jgi:hypothetical protein
LYLITKVIKTINYFLLLKMEEESKVVFGHYINPQHDKKLDEIKDYLTEVYNDVNRMESDDDEKFF